MCFGFCTNAVKELLVAACNHDSIQSKWCLKRRLNLRASRFARCRFTPPRIAAKSEEVAPGDPEEEEEAGADHDFPSVFPPIKIVYEDAHIVVVSKPGGMLVHRSKESTRETVFLLQTLRDQLGGRKVPAAVRDA